MYDIMSDMKSYVISGMILFLQGYIYDTIYDIMYFMISCMISYVLILISYTISYTISYKNLWYHVLYHIYPFLVLLWYCQKDMISYMISYCNYDIIYDIIFFYNIIVIYPFLALFFLWYCLRYHIHITRNLPWYQYLMICHMKSEHISHDMALWYQYLLISLPCDITDFMISSPISWHLRGWMARVGGASFQVLHLLWPHHRQLWPTCWAVSGDCCSAERRLPESSAWICCSRCCQVSSLRWKFSSWT